MRQLSQHARWPRKTTIFWDLDAVGGLFSCLATETVLFSVCVAWSTWKIYMFWLIFVSPYDHKGNDQDRLRLDYEWWGRLTGKKVEMMTVAPAGMTTVAFSVSDLFRHFQSMHAYSWTVLGTNWFELLAEIQRLPAALKVTPVCNPKLFVIVSAIILLLQVFLAMMLTTKNVFISMSWNAVLKLCITVMWISNMYIILHYYYGRIDENIIFCINSSVVSHFIVFNFYMSKIRP